MPGSKPYPVPTHAAPQRSGTVVLPPAGTTTDGLRVLTSRRAPDTPTGSWSRTHRSTARTPPPPSVPLRRKLQVPAPLPGMERRTVTPGSWFVTAAFSATALAGQLSASVLDPSAGTVVVAATELGTTTSAARALAGAARSASVSGMQRAILWSIRRSYHRFARFARRSILAA